jgi:hypothetical protein
MLGCAVNDGCGGPIADGPWAAKRDTGSIILVRDGGRSPQSCHYYTCESTMLTVQGIERVSPEPRFVSSVSWRRASCPGVSATFALADALHGSSAKHRSVGRVIMPVRAGSLCPTRFTVTTGLRLAPRWGLGDSGGRVRVPDRLSRGISVQPDPLLQMMDADVVGKK